MDGSSVPLLGCPRKDLKYAMDTKESLITPPSQAVRNISMVFRGDIRVEDTDLGESLTYRWWFNP